MMINQVNFTIVDQRKRRNYRTVVFIDLVVTTFVAMFVTQFVTLFVTMFVTQFVTQFVTLFAGSSV